MSTYVFAWNPRLWGWPELAGDIARVRRRGHVDIEWACGRTRAIEPGSRAFFVRLGVPPKGILGSGYTLTAPVSRLHWRAEKAAVGTLTHYLDLRLEVLTDTPLIAFDELARPPYSRFRWAVRQSGMRLPSSIADALEPWWEERVEQARLAAPTASTAPRAPTVPTVPTASPASPTSPTSPAPAPTTRPTARTAPAARTRMRRPRRSRR